ncbi:Regulator of sigma D [Vibrio stylophorae]|uniref:Regulator of sigma D n=1 Tax=Vibrio stylophorae TaxID=659351 RepID=A0ABM8ZR42_9VIBR|nr:sigma D regulator [Vibrio stylophorae]CAH0532370.1 Regulator of sigma D [Vibrio stylophorae]
MLTKLQKTQEQWAGASDVIDHWLDIRQKLLIEYCKLSGLPPFKSNVNHLPTPAELQNFCQELVDYISAGHFRIYDMVMDQWRRSGYSPTDEINQAYFHITETTEPLLSFSDKYGDVDPNDELIKLDADLSRVGEIMEIRFAREDHLIQLIADSLAVPPGA